MSEEVEASGDLNMSRGRLSVDDGGGYRESVVCKFNGIGC